MWRCRRINPHDLCKLCGKSSPAAPRTKVSLDASATISGGVHICLDQSFRITDLDFVLGCCKAVESAGAGRLAATIAVADVAVGLREDVLLEYHCDAAAETGAGHALS